ncbi:ImmA/IrrE family metallo-endopeptidase [Clostridium gasigenes]|uniref:ImmA/IrrE family metallo-endopeptidase n=1 Tax=Clostridium gasigenes TaxID=94869 RepID=A0A7X0SEW0_9CLOT|nr:ImmA/IrrE family metallo-endopeptidase [Clostridium gasigenes]MBB6716330.1 ImmA/IrrE family metallo-endopeptidase [Clostridium gasigenes]
MGFWIDDILVGIENNYGTNNIYDLCGLLEIEIILIDSSSILLNGNDSFYCRDFFNQESVFIRDDLSPNCEKFILAHELGHALLHTSMCGATLNRKLFNTGKYENQANYFALKFLKIEFDEIELKEMTVNQISSCLGIPCDPLLQLVNC